MTATALALTPRERMMRALRGETVDRPPVWMMRQAGRYLPEYQAIRARHDFLTMCREPEVAAEVTLQPVARFGVDAAIVFNDILIPLEAMGVPVVFTGRGPELTKPLHANPSLAGFHSAAFGPDEPVARSLRLLAETLSGETALLGFAGAPFTLACYAVEGRLTRDLSVIRRLRHTDPRRLHRILGLITETVIDYLRVQIEAGADAVQLFETWGGVLSHEDYCEFALPYQQEVIRRLRPLAAPVTLYLRSAAHLLGLVSGAGADALSVDWTLPLSTVREIIGPRRPLQGNLDPLILTTTPEAVAAATRAMLDDVRGHGPHIANLGHGILPATPPACAEAFVRTVQEHRP